MVALRLFLPESWTSDPARLKRTGVPIEHCGARSEPEIALAEIDRVIAAGVRFGCVLADAGCGSSAPFRHALSERDLLWAVGLSRRQKVYPGNVTMIFPTEKARKPREHHIPDMSPVSAETALIGEKWRKISWRRGTKGPLTCLFAARRVRIADGPRHRVFDKGVERMPGAGVWVLGERRPGGEQKYYVSNLPADVPLRTLTAAVKARWICEQAHQQLKEELGLDHFEGRSWVGLHPQALMTMIAYAFLQSRRLIAADRKKEATAHRHSQVCRPCAAPSSNSFFDQQISDAHTAEDKAPECSGTNKSAKVVPERFQAKHVLGLDPRMGTGSREENASKQ